MKAKTTMNQASLKQLAKARIQAVEMTAEAVKSDMITSGVVPKQIGTLERSGFVDTSKLSKGEAKIVFDAPYARRLYWHPEYDFRTDKNANARGKWMQTYIDGEKKNFAREAFRKLYKRLAGGVVK